MFRLLSLAFFSEYYYLKAYRALLYRGADKSLARPWKETSYSDRTYKTIPRLMPYKQQQYIAVLCTP